MCQSGYPTSTSLDSQIVLSEALVQVARASKMSYDASNAVGCLVAPYWKMLLQAAALGYAEKTALGNQ